MFTQKISMDCTREQYEKYLKDELLKMGYKEFCFGWPKEGCTLVTQYIGDDCSLTTFPLGDSGDNRHYIGSFNAPLFLALAAMTDKTEGNYGEYVVGLRTGRFYRMNKDDRILSEYKFVRKATKEEIMAKFGDVKISGKIEYPLDVTCKTDDESYFYATEAQMISHLKSKGYKILKPKTWEEI